jgi:hypothetical protein
VIVFQLCCVAAHVDIMTAGTNCGGGGGYKWGVGGCLPELQLQQHSPPLCCRPPEADGVWVLVIQLCCVVVHHIKDDLDASIMEPAISSTSTSSANGTMC